MYTDDHVSIVCNNWTNENSLNVQQLGMAKLKYGRSIWIILGVIKIIFIKAIFMK